MYMRNATSNKHILLLVLFMVFLALCQKPQWAHATLNVNIEKGNVKPSTFIIGHFTSNSVALKEYSIDDVIAKNLNHSGFFKLLGRTDDGVDVVPDFAEYREAGAVILITGEVKRSSSDSLDVYVRVWDIVMGKQIIGKVISTKSKNWRRVGHVIGDEIYRKITGNAGYFDSKIVYISESGSFFHRRKRLAVMDQDGGNNIFLTSGTHMVLTPVVSPNGNNIMYVSYSNREPKVYFYNVLSRKTYVVGSFPGMTSSPRFSPTHDDVIALSITQGGHTNIYKMRLRRNQIKQLTNSQCINTSPFFSPNGNKITFVSDRAGSQQIYVMNSDGSGQKRISLGYGQYSTPAWSPTGEYIAFTKMEEGEFFIGIMKPDGTGERLLAKGYMVEGPSWSPNGRLIVFTKEMPGTATTKNSKIYTIDISGRNERMLDTPEDASDPFWHFPSPR